jgi:hypothetical protein
VRPDGCGARPTAKVAASLLLAGAKDDDDEDGEGDGSGRAPPDAEPADDAPREFTRDATKPARVRKGKEKGGLKMSAMRARAFFGFFAMVGCVFGGHVWPLS